MWNRVMVYEKSSEGVDVETLRVGDRTVETGYDYRKMDTESLIEHHESLVSVNQYTRSPAFVQQTVVSTLIFLLPFLALSMVPLGIDTLTAAVPETANTIQIAANGVFSNVSTAFALGVAGFLLIWFAVILIHSARKHEVMNQLCDEIVAVEDELRRRDIDLTGR